MSTYDFDSTYIVAEDDNVCVIAEVRGEVYTHEERATWDTPGSTDIEGASIFDICVIVQYDGHELVIDDSEMGYKFVMEYLELWSCVQDDIHSWMEEEVDLGADPADEDYYEPTWHDEWMDYDEDC